MTIVKISDLTELTSPANGDQFVVVDVSEPLDIDKTKRISFSTLMTIANAAIPKSIVTTVGDLIYATASATLARLAKPAVDSVLKMGSAGTPSWKALSDFVSVYRRQGSSATHWNYPGTTTYTPTAPITQVGSATFNSGTACGSPSTGYYYQEITITFPVAYVYNPVVYLSIDVSAVSTKQNYVFTISQTIYSNTYFKAMLVTNLSTLSTNPVSLNWMAIGE